MSNRSQLPQPSLQVTLLELYMVANYTEEELRHGFSIVPLLVICSQKRRITTFRLIQCQIRCLRIGNIVQCTPQNKNSWNFTSKYLFQFRKIGHDCPISVARWIIVGVTRVSEHAQLFNFGEKFFTRFGPVFGETPSAFSRNSPTKICAEKTISKLCDTWQFRDGNFQFREIKWIQDTFFEIHNDQQCVGIQCQHLFEYAVQFASQMPSGSHLVFSLVITPSLFVFLEFKYCPLFRRNLFGSVTFSSFLMCIDLSQKYASRANQCAEAESKIFEAGIDRSLCFWIKTQKATIKCIAFSIDGKRGPSNKSNYDEYRAADYLKMPSKSLALRQEIALQERIIALRNRHWLRARWRNVIDHSLALSTQSLRGFFKYCHNSSTLAYPDRDEESAADRAGAWPTQGQGFASVIGGSR